MRSILITGGCGFIDPQITQTRLPLPRPPRVAKHCGQGGTSGQVTQENELAAKKRKKGRNLIRRLRRLHGLMMRDQKTYAIIGAAMEVQSAD